MKDKRGKVVPKSILQIIIGVAILIILVWLLFSLISPSSDRVVDVSKSYLDTLKDTINVADSDRVGSFSIWEKAKEENDILTGYHLVYFGEDNVVNKEFYYLEAAKNTICICSWQKENVRCNECFNLKYPAIKDGNRDSWSVSGEKGDLNLKVKKEGDEYVFFKK